MEMHICLFITSLFIGHVQCRIKANDTTFESAYITGPLNDLIISKTFSAPSLLKCASACHAVNSISLYYLQNDKTCSCTDGTDDSVEATTVDTDIKYAWIKNSFKVFDFETYRRIEVIPIPIDCLEFYNLGYHEDGVYQIQPEGGDKVDTWCDMANGGWTVIQRRHDGSEDFYRNLNEYVNGFGNRHDEYWLGLENIHKLTLDSTTLRIDMMTFGDVDPTSAYAEYSHFQTDSAATTYVLDVDGYYGDCGDGLTEFQNGMPFATKDPQNLCAVVYKGAWWYSAGATCHHSNLNGYYYGGNHTSLGDGVNWSPCWGQHYSLNTTVMKIMRNV